MSYPRENHPAKTWWGMCGALSPTVDMFQSRGALMSLFGECLYRRVVERNSCHASTATMTVTGA